MSATTARTVHVSPHYPPPIWTVHDRGMIKREFLDKLDARIYRLQYLRRQLRSQAEIQSLMEKMGDFIDKENARTAGRSR